MYYACVNTKFFFSLHGRILFEHETICPVVVLILYYAIVYNMCSSFIIRINVHTYCGFDTTRVECNIEITFKIIK